MAAVKRQKRAKPRKAAKKPSLLWRLLRWPVRLVVLTGLLAVAWVGVYRWIDPPGGYYMLSESLRLDGVAHDWRDLDQISPHLVRSVMAGEDARFCDHQGFDFEAIRAAMRANEEGGRVRGASTITQQTAKNVFLWHQRSWLRKGLEAGFTVLIELMWPKARIIEVYLNIVEFAPGVFGAEAAARHHFGRSAESLGPVHSSRLAAVLPSPKTRNAAKPTGRVIRRARAIAAGARTLAADRRDTCAF